MHLPHNDFRLAGARTRERALPLSVALLHGETLMPDNKFEALARAGYGARGAVYFLLGALALTSAFWGGGGSEDTSSALSSLLGLPFGRIVLALIAVGLLGYVLWKLAQGLLNADHVEDNPKGLLTRSGNLISAGANIFLLLTAARLAWQGGGAGGGNGEETASAWLLQQPFGPFLLGLAGLGIIAAGIVQIWYGASSNYKRRLSLPSNAAWLEKISQFGLIARGVVLAVVGGFILYAAFTVSPDQAGGTREALDYVRQLPFGTWLYAIVALGLVAFGAYGFIQARYRHINAPSLPSAVNPLSKK